LVPLAAAAQAQKYAFLVGVNEYQHDKLRKLDWAENDVVELGALLARHGYQVTVLTSSAKNAAKLATQANIVKQLKAVLKGCRKGDTVLAAFAGHGLQFQGEKDCFFCPLDARPFKKNADSLISMKELYEELDASFAGMKVLLVDACRDDPNGGRNSR